MIFELFKKGSLTLFLWVICFLGIIGLQIFLRRESRKAKNFLF